MPYIIHYGHLATHPSEVLIQPILERCASTLIDTPKCAMLSSKASDTSSNIDHAVSEASGSSHGSSPSFVTNARTRHRACVPCWRCCFSGNVLGGGGGGSSSGRGANAVPGAARDAPRIVSHHTSNFLLSSKPRTPIWQAHG